jgi:hypothetical protein
MARSSSKGLVCVEVLTQTNPNLQIPWHLGARIGSKLIWKFQLTLFVKTRAYQIRSAKECCNIIEHFYTFTSIPRSNHRIMKTKVGLEDNITQMECSFNFWMKLAKPALLARTITVSSLISLFVITDTDFNPPRFRTLITGTSALFFMWFWW